ncbi:protein FMC1 homolog isoform X2 [Tachypleus tridentatus]|uniref:protein FMC1 homolog isoform X2 n=1 Tax=Tachypleus tridentatus TaxID=6853 RepID=UPI003FD10697
MQIYFLKSVIQNPIFRYILEQTRKHQVTEKQICRGQAELQYLARTYLCYLSSIRRQKDHKSRAKKQIFLLERKLV